MHPNRMVALVDDLEERKLVRRRPHPSDRRARTVVLTAAGRDLLEKAYAIATQIEAHLCAELDGREREQLLNLLAKLHPAEAVPALHPKVLAALDPGLPA